MRSTVKMPRAADTVDEVVVSEVLVAPGVAVQAGDPLLRVETDKALVDVPSPIAGTVVEIHVAVDDEVATGAPIVILEWS